MKIKKDSPPAASPSRFLFLDILRVVGAAAVILIHICASFVAQFGRISPVNWWIGNVIDAGSRWSVPVFFMISGWLHLVEKKSIQPRKLYQKRLLRLGLPLLCWIIIYAVVYHIWRDDPLSWQFVLKRILFDQPYEHLYFLFILIAFSLFTPALAKVVQQLETDSLGFVTIFLFGIGFFWIKTRFVIPFFIPYLCYYVAGAYLRRSSLPRKRLPLVLASFLVSWLIISIGTYLNYQGITHFALNQWLYEYLSLPVIVMSVSIFMLFQYTITELHASKKLISFITFFVPLTFGIYLVHPAILEILTHILHVSPLAYGFSAISIPFLFGVTFFLSASFVFICSKIRLARMMLLG